MDKTYRQKYYDKHKERLCRKKLEDDCFRYIERDRSLAEDTVERLMKEYPYDIYQAFISKVCHQRRVFRDNNSYLWDECNSVAFLAYLYSICRCAVMGYSYVENYIRKMVRVYIGCELTVYYSGIKYISFDEVSERKMNRGKYFDD